MAQVIGEEGQLIKISLERGNKEACSFNCKGVYRVGGESFCCIIGDNMPNKRPIECIKAEINKNIKIKRINKCCGANCFCHPRVINGIPTCKSNKTNDQTIAKCVILED